MSCGYSSFLGADLFLSNNKCLIVCTTGYWGNITDHKCTACPTGCSACFNGTIDTCTACANASGTIYYKAIGNTVCNTTCPDGQFISSSVPFFCQPCSPTCITCSVTAENCSTTSCPANFFYLNNSCLSACPTGYYPDSSRQCQICATGCSICFASGASSCTKCMTLTNNTAYYLKKDLNTCATTCDDGYYGNSTTNLCVACSAACKKCTSGTVCQSCQSVNGVGYYLNGTSCLIVCPLGSYGLVSSYTC